jgi:hypothetical protein
MGLVLTYCEQTSALSTLLYSVPCPIFLWYPYKFDWEWSGQKIYPTHTGIEPLAQGTLEIKLNKPACSNTTAQIVLSSHCNFKLYRVFLKSGYIGNASNYNCLREFCKALKPVHRK